MARSEKTVIGKLETTKDLLKDRKGQACFVQYNGTSLGKRLPIQEKILTLGRDANCNICLTEESISRQHAKIFNEDGDIFIEDLGSSNGTFINDKKISQKMPLRDQDMLKLGNIILKFYDQYNVDGYIQDKIYQTATVDKMTGINNRSHTLDILKQEYEMSRSSGSPLSLIYYDLDHFKKVNDTLGHDAGDQVLKLITKLIQENLAPEAILGRIGGEEFLAIVPGKDLKASFAICEKFREACSKKIFSLEITENNKKKTIEHNQTISAGIALRDESMSEVKDLMDAADKKLYESKTKGRNQSNY